MKRHQLKIVPLELAEANELVRKWHRHHHAVPGHKFSLGVVCGAEIVGAAIVGRPVSRSLLGRNWLEVNRLVTDGTPNACSALYGACAKVAKAMGYESIQTYILDEEPGTSLRGAGWELSHITKGGSWNRKCRSRVDKFPLAAKACWKKQLNDPVSFSKESCEIDSKQKTLFVLR